MRPIVFPEVTALLAKPENMTITECRPLPVMNDGHESVSCWSLSLAERLRVLVSGRVWLGILAGKTQPPVRLMVDKPIEGGKICRS